MLKIKYIETVNRKRVKKECTVYTLDEFNGEYVGLNDFRMKVWKVGVGDWIETVDGYVVPVIKSEPSYFRIPSLDGYSRIHRPVYFRKKFLPIFEKACGNYPLSDDLTDQQGIFVWELATTWNLVLATHKARYGHINQGLKILQLPKIQKALRMSLKAMIETLGRDEKDLFFSRWEKMMDSLQKGVEKNLEENPEGSAKLAEVMTKNLTQISDLLYSDSGTARLNSGGFVAFGKLPAAKRGFDLYKEEQDATKQITNGENG